jgi:hypothetical protein
MPVWLATADTKVTPMRNALHVLQEHLCVVCDSPLERLARRDRTFPYHWQPFGWVCSSCNAMYMAYDIDVATPGRPLRQR